MAWTGHRHCTAFSRIYLVLARIVSALETRPRAAPASTALQVMHTNTRNAQLEHSHKCSTFRCRGTGQQRPLQLNAGAFEGFRRSNSRLSNFRSVSEVHVTASTRNRQRLCVSAAAAQKLSVAISGEPQRISGSGSGAIPLVMVT